MLLSWRQPPGPAGPNIDSSPLVNVLQSMAALNPASREPTLNDDLLDKPSPVWTQTSHTISDLADLDPSNAELAADPSNAELTAVGLHADRDVHSRQAFMFTPR